MAAKNNFRKILVVRTDRLGDVVLTTPVLKALRDGYPQSHIAIMVNPYVREIVEDNPYIDEVIVYDKDRTHKGLMGFWKFVLALKRKKFDLAIVLHTKKRTNLITFLADIPRRIGYHDKKFGFLLTDKVKDTRTLGVKHEVEYCLDILRRLGLEVTQGLPHIALKKEARQWAENILQEEGIKKKISLPVFIPGQAVFPNVGLKRDSLCYLIG